MKISTRTHRVTREKIESITSSIQRMDQILLMYGPGVIDLLTETLSLRQVARKVKRSPTYLSQVKNGKQRISWETYCLLVMLLEESDNSGKMKPSSRTR